jgi:hypothetical protein
MIAGDWWQIRQCVVVHLHAKHLETLIVGYRAVFGDLPVIHCAGASSDTLFLLEAVVHTIIIHVGILL